jgi:hypothetical protein
MKIPERLREEPLVVKAMGCRKNGAVTAVLGPPALGLPF